MARFPPYSQGPSLALGPKAHGGRRLRGTQDAQGDLGEFGCSGTNLCSQDAGPGQPAPACWVRLLSHWPEVLEPGGCPVFSRRVSARKCLVSPTPAGLPFQFSRQNRFRGFQIFYVLVFVRFFSISEFISVLKYV